MAGTQNSPISIASSPPNFSTAILSPQRHSTPQSTPQYWPSRLCQELRNDAGNKDEEGDSYLPSFNELLRSQKLSEPPASTRSAPQYPEWHPHPDLAEHWIVPLRKAIERFPPEHRLLPKNKDIFQNVEECFEHLQNFALFTGFAVVKLAGENQARTRHVFGCRHHGEYTRNYRNLDDRSGEGSNRVRDNTHVSQKNCEWSIRLAYKQIHQRQGKESSNMQWVLTITQPEHSHKDMMPNPLEYSEHRKRLPETHEALQAATQLAHTKESYTAVRRQLENQGLTIDRKAYYNMRQKLVAEWGTNQDGFLHSVEDKLRLCNFRYFIRHSVEVDPRNGQLLSRNIQQIVFWLPEQVAFMRRFVPDFCIQIDGTFNVSRDRLILGIATGLAHTLQGFPGVMTFMKTESQENWLFFLDIIYNHVLGKQKPKVIISDFGKGLTAAIPDSHLSDSIQQYCQWHAAKAMMKTIRERKHYTKEQKANITGSGNTSQNCLIWQWLKSCTKDDLERNQSKLLRHW
jgi:hypothetical protein